MIESFYGEHCMGCGREYDLIWMSNNNLWNKIWGAENGLLCPDCFDKRCRNKDILLRWIPVIIYSKDDNKFRIPFIDEFMRLIG
jgi:hypothetical protein